jgi:branched-chain amino acid aminotransferase
MAKSMHDISGDPRNASILINVNGEMKPRGEAVVSVFDSGFILGDGVWEGLRVHKGRIAFLDRISIACSRRKGNCDGHRPDARAAGQSALRNAGCQRMSEGVHIRLMVTRGVRSTPYQDPRVVVGGATIVIIPEYKRPILRSSSKV